MTMLAARGVSPQAARRTGDAVQTERRSSTRERRERQPIVAKKYFLLEILHGFSYRERLKKLCVIYKGAARKRSNFRLLTIEIPRPDFSFINVVDSVQPSGLFVQEFWAWTFADDPLARVADALRAFALVRAGVNTG